MSEKQNTGELEVHPLLSEVEEFLERINEKYLQQGTNCGLVVSLVTETDEQTEKNECSAICQIVGAPDALLEAFGRILANKGACQMLSIASRKLK